MTEIINLEAIQHLPKGTEFFVSDLHGEHGAFDYLLRNGSGIIRTKIDEYFGDDLSHSDKDEMALLIYYPTKQIALIRERRGSVYVEQYLEQVLPDLVKLLQYMGSKYTRSKVRKLLPSQFSYIIEELVAEIERSASKAQYFQVMIDKIVQLDQLENLVEALSEVIQSLAVDHLHVVGDIFDRGPEPDLILDRLASLRSVDIQWGNHDVTWMGAMAGSLICMVNIVRISARYNNLSLIEDSYGINLRPLIAYSQTHYQPKPAFVPILDEGNITEEESNLLNQLQQATAILQFKLEDALIERRPDFQLDHRRLLQKINFKEAKIQLGESSYPLRDFNATCINPEKPDQLTSEEMEILEQLRRNFLASERLKRHVDFLFEHGSMYLSYNDMLLYHGCIPMHDNGDFKSLRIGQALYRGKSLLDFYEEQIRQSYRNPTVDNDLATDLFWYLWVGECSSLFGKAAMTTFERYYIEDKATHKEEKNAYYRLRQRADICEGILEEFGLEKESHIVNGHTPVREIDGENPIKAEGKLLVIDGGFAKGYQKKTGLAGYTLVSNSYGLELVAHKAFKEEIQDLEWLYTHYEDY
ncbi:fructose-1,6-bisphosphatase [Streptococcus danieliae]|uniref:Fructose-1,6-bisphosphatase class 3 n=1 Tax=Streptococcus danieliae TaxID=747656 RepID=A0A7Z0M5X7_9STRE|nr:fructose-1,6-bisphosphatase [Streptococcus danieliae]MBF0699228.1 fructose-1,6-bisphosphatase [Streptococcus danieliae]NYS96404.1 fructose-1,6-bisphosphatase [Streptococcus danieliae]